MILDSRGRPMARQIGFIGGLSVENPGPRGKKKQPVELAPAIGFVVDRDEDDDDEEDSSLEENGKA
jgi:hypothetical protein